MIAAVQFGTGRMREKKSAGTLGEGNREMSKQELEPFVGQIVKATGNFSGSKFRANFAAVRNNRIATMQNVAVETNATVIQVGHAHVQYADEIFGLKPVIGDRFTFDAEVHEYRKNVNGQDTVSYGLSNPSNVEKLVKKLWIEVPKFTSISEEIKQEDVKQKPEEIKREQIKQEPEKTKMTHEERRERRKNIAEDIAHGVPWKTIAERESLSYQTIRNIAKEINDTQSGDVPMPPDEPQPKATKKDNTLNNIRKIKQVGIKNIQTILELQKEIGVAELNEIMELLIES